MPCKSVANANHMEDNGEVQKYKGDPLAVKTKLQELRLVIDDMFSLPIGDDLRHNPNVAE